MRLRPIAAPALLVLAGTATAANAHDAGSWDYPLACCKGTSIGGDCHKVPTEHVVRGRQGYFILLHRGDHPKVTRDHQFFVPYGNELTSPDGDYHSCLHPTEDDLNCFFAPPDML